MLEEIKQLFPNNKIFYHSEVYRINNRFPKRRKTIGTAYQIHPPVGESEIDALINTYKERITIIYKETESLKQQLLVIHTKAEIERLLKPSNQ